MSRVLGGGLRTIGPARQMYAEGLPFGLGVDTASEAALSGDGLSGRLGLRMARRARAHPRVPIGRVHPAAAGQCRPPQARRHAALRLCFPPQGLGLPH